MLNIIAYDGGPIVDKGNVLPNIDVHINEALNNNPRHTCKVKVTVFGSVCIPATDSRWLMRKPLVSQKHLEKKLMAILLLET